MKPVRVEAPSQAPIELAEVRLHLDADPNDYSQDAMFWSWVEEAVAQLDGWGGYLGRAIMPQVWQEEFDGWGDLRLSLPDVVDAEVSYLDASGAFVEVPDAEVFCDEAGFYVTADGPQSDRVRVRYTCALPEASLPSVRAAIKLYARHQMDHRGNADPGAEEYFQRAFRGRIAHLVWGF
ncbi:hypothetical protein [Cereibacter sphaeroides]|jgi:hypothetical protein|uniref:hypothetical protein n=1 Tax=Cereibacter sphaeroides TaxID=1063 RepID=UPI000066411B|nr:hypothetical protein Rsph17029_0641 [Cereibacter sphaeroides ATCC 17029]